MSAVTVDEMRPRLLALADVKERLAATEPIDYVSLPVGDTVRFQVSPNWNQSESGQPAAVLRLGAAGRQQEFPLTKDALLEATSACGLPRAYVQKAPGLLVEPQLNYWFRQGFGEGKEFKLLLVGGVGTAINKASIQPFSNLRLLDMVLAGIYEKYGADAEILVDYKFAHSLRQTHLRLIVPDSTRQITGTAVADDPWSVGVQLRNSLTGVEQTSVDGYMFRWVCTNGSIDTHATSGVWSRRGGQGDEVYEWARVAVDDVLGGLEGALDAVQEMVEAPVEGMANLVLKDVFAQYQVPATQRHEIIANLVETTDLTMYSVMQAVTQVANGADVTLDQQSQLMRIGGDLSHRFNARCESCHRMI